MKEESKGRRTEGKIAEGQLQRDNEEQTKCCCFVSQTFSTLHFPVCVKQPHTQTFSQKDTYLALATSRVSVKRKRCLSWVCRPVFSCD